MRKKKNYLVRFTEDDWRLIDQVAKKNDTWAATWIREVVIRELIRLGKRKETPSNIREYCR